MESFAQRGQRKNEIDQEKMKKRDYGTNGNNGKKGNFIDFRFFRYFRLFRNLSSLFTDAPQAQVLRFSRRIAYR